MLGLIQPEHYLHMTIFLRVQKQYLRILSETRNLKELFKEIYSKFLKAIDHMEYHPSLGKEKKGASFKLHRKRSEGIDPRLA